MRLTLKKAITVKVLQGPLKPAVVFIYSGTSGKGHFGANSFVSRREVVPISGVPYHCILRGYGRIVCVREYDYRYTSTYQVSDCVQAGTVLYSSISRDKHHTRLK